MLKDFQKQEIYFQQRVLKYLSKNEFRILEIRYFTPGICSVRELYNVPWNNITREEIILYLDAQRWAFTKPSAWPQDDSPTLRNRDLLYMPISPGIICYPPYPKNLDELVERARSFIRLKRERKKRRK